MRRKHSVFSLSQTLLIGLGKDEYRPCHAERSEESVPDGQRDFSPSLRSGLKAHCAQHDRAV